MKRAVIVFLALIFLFLLFRVSPSSSASLDFQVLYNANDAVLHAIPLYDHDAQVQLVANQAGVSVDKILVLPFPYPPWYAVSTLFLALFPIEVAARLWFEISLLMIFLSIWYLTDGWAGYYRLLAFPAAILFFPALGMLSVGQYDAPVLLGTSLTLYSVKHRYPVLTAVGMALLTFKPHIGGLIFLCGLIYMFLQRDSFAKRVLLYTFVLGIFLFAVGFLADSAWPVNYFNSLLNYSGVERISSCSECTSAAVWLSRWQEKGSAFSQVGLIAAILLIFSVSLLFLMNRFIWKACNPFIVASILVSLIASPYLYNYDYILLIIPFVFLLDQIKGRLARIILGLCYFTPYFAIGFYGRAGNISLIVITLILFVLFCFKIKQGIDVPAQPA